MIHIFYSIINGLRGSFLPPISVNLSQKNGVFSEKWKIFKNQRAPMKDEDGGKERGMGKNYLKLNGRGRGIVGNRILF